MLTAENSNFPEYETAINILQNFLERQQSKNSGQVNSGQVLTELAKTHYWSAYHVRPATGLSRLPPPDCAALLQLAPATFVQPPNYVHGEPVSAADLKHLDRAIELLESELAQALDLLRLFGRPSIGAQTENTKAASSAALAKLKDPQYVRQLYLLALCYRDRSQTHWFSPDQTVSELHQRAINILERLSEQFPNEPVYRFELFKTLSDINVFLPGLADLPSERVVTSLTSALDIATKLVAQSPQATGYQMEWVHRNYKLHQTVQLLDSNSASDQAKVLSEPSESSNFAGSPSVLSSNLSHIAYLSAAYQAQEEVLQRFPDSFAQKVWAIKFGLELVAATDRATPLEQRGQILQTSKRRLAELSNQQR